MVKTLEQAPQDMDNGLETRAGGEQRGVWRKSYAAGRAAKRRAVGLPAELPGVIAALASRYTARTVNVTWVLAWCGLPCEGAGEPVCFGS